MKGKLLLFSIFFFVALLNKSQTSVFTGWTSEMKNESSFIENKGQFHIPGSKEIPLYQFGGADRSIFLLKNGITYTFLKQWKKKEKSKREINKEKYFSAEEHRKEEDSERKMEFTKDLVNVTWLNSNSNVLITGEEITDAYHSYSYFASDGKMENINFIRGYKKITYHNLYDNIDVVYTIHPENGIKYSLIVRPGADLSIVQMAYSVTPKINSEGSLLIQTKLGEIIEHAPISFYARNSGNIISSSYSKKGKIVSFQTSNYDRTLTLVIDPWVQLPTFGTTTWNCVWECEKDGAGNVYALGGGASQSANSQMQIKKYNATGVLQWTYNTPYDTSNCWLGTFATDNAGNSYVTRGSVSGMQKINTAGTLVWNNNGGGGTIGNSDEYWNIAFNCDQTKLIVGGTTGAFALPPLLEAAIFDIDVNNGNILSTKKVAVGPAFSVPPNLQEVRSITPSPNGKYYYLTQDTIGYVNQNFNLCPSGLSGGLKINNGIDFGYKCEDYRFDNSGIMAIRADSNFLYVNRGNQLQKRSLQNLSVVATASIPGGGFNNVFLGGNTVSNSGIDIDQCGNIYVGSKNQVVKFNSSMAVVATYTTSYNVYDVHVMPSGDIVVCGSTGTSGTTGSRTGYIQVISAGACNTLALSCCNTGICLPANFCQNDPAINLTAATPGGVWSGTGITNAALGTFNPSVAGVGTHTISYALPCGSESITVTVLGCQALSVCAEANGNITVNGSGTFTWYQQTTTQNCSACLVGCVFPPGCAINVTGWTSFTTGSTITPTGNYPIYVINNNGDSAYIPSFASLPGCSACSISASIASQSNVSCNGGNNGSATVTQNGGSGTISYSWSPFGGSAATANGLSAGNYTCTITAGSCTATATVSITEPPSISTATTSTDASCGSSNGTAGVSATGGTGTLTYLWSPGGQTGSNANNLSAGTYTCTITDANSCSVTAFVTVNNQNGPTVSVGGQNNNLCFGDSSGTAQVSVTGGNGNITYNWQPYGGNSNTATGLANGTYTCTVTDAANCTSTQTINITSPSSINSTVSSTPASCGLADGSVSVSASGGTGGYTYNWQPGSQNNSTVTGLSAGIYTVTITDQNNCVTTDTVQISNLNPPVIIATANGPFCEGSSINLSASGGVTYSWAGPNGFTSTTQNPTIFPAALTQSGTYTVTGTDANGCVNTSTVSVLVTPTPTVSVSSSSYSVSSGSSVVITASGANTYNWNPGGQTGSQLTINAANEGLFTYCAIGTTSQGCQDSACVIFSVFDLDCGSLYIPNAFSPNGDNSNDELCVYGTLCVNQIQLKIYDRWGEKVFESNSTTNNCWDGKFNGTALNAGVYAYILTATFNNGTSTELKGNISLVK